MKKSILQMLLVPLFFITTSLAYADDSHHKDSGSNASSMDMSNIQVHMDKMQSLMTKVSNTKSEKERQALMQEHMKEMNQSMEMMNGMMTEQTEGHMMQGKQIFRC